MSESPASKMDMVEQRKSLPQAVPSSICRAKRVYVSQCFLPSKAKIDGFFSGWLPEHDLTAGAVKQSNLEIRKAQEQTQTYVVAGEVVNGSLGKHGVVLELRLAERGSVGGDDDELGLAVTEGLQGRLVSQSDWMQKHVRIILSLYSHACLIAISPFPLFITRANLELMLSPDFLLLGAIVTLSKSPDFRSN